MASGSINLNNSGLSSGGGYLMGKLEWSSTPNTETNKSSVTVRLYAKKASTTGTITTPTTGNWDCSMTVNGENTSQMVYAGITADWVLLLEKTVSVAHDSDGSKTIQVSGSVWGPSGTAYSGLQTTGSGSARLDSIPRASTMTVSGAALGGEVTFHITAASAAFTHSLTYEYGEASGTLLSYQPAGTHKWTAPLALAAQFPNARTGTVTYKLYTWNGTGVSVGVKTYTANLSIPESAGPSVSSGWATAAYYNAGTAAAAIAAFVQGYSRAQVTFDSSKITTKYGAAIAGYKIACGGVTDTASPYLTGVLTGTSAEITCTVTDSRGYTASGTISVTLNAYKKPALSDISLYRADEDGTANPAGLCIYAKAALTFSPIGGNNTCTLKGYFRLQGGSYGTGIEMTSGTGLILTNAAAATSTYVAKIEAADSLGNKAAYEATIPTDDVAFHIRDGGKGAAFGKYAEEDNLLDVAWNLHVGGWPTACCELLLTRTEGWASGASVSLPELADCDMALVAYSGSFTWTTTPLRTVLIPVGGTGVLEAIGNVAVAGKLMVVQRKLTIGSTGTVTSGGIYIKEYDSTAAPADSTTYPYALSPWKIYGLKWN